jgi:uridylate kinase
MNQAKPAYGRIILELSGEMFRGEPPVEGSIDFDFLGRLSQKLVQIRDMGVQLGVVVGGGNIWRGAEHAELERATSDQIGMLATVINALTLRETIRKQGGDAFVFSALNIERIAEPRPHPELIERMSKGQIVIFAAGTGNPFFTTDTGAVLRALEVGADAVLKATKVDGLYSDDPVRNPDAVRYSELTCDEALSMRAGVMDLTAFALCCGKELEIVIFKLLPLDNIVKVILGHPIGTRIRGK